MWIVIAWAIGGILALASEKISKLTFGITWFCLMGHLIEDYLM